MATGFPSPTDESDPPDKRALDCHRRGLKCYRTGDLRGAAEWIGRAVELDATVPRYHNNLAVALRNLGRLAEAAEACRRALALDADYADAHTNLGHTLYDQGSPEDARTHFCRALELEPDHADALFGLGTLHFDRDETDEAIRRFRESLVVRPDHPATYSNLGNALHKAGKPGEAIAAYERAVALDPALTATAVQLARVYAQEGLIDEARQSFARLAERFPDDPVWRLHPLALCPTIFPNREAIDDYRASVEAGLKAVGDVSLTVAPDSVAANGVVPSFFFSHHGRNNRPLKEGFAAVFEPVLGGPRPRPRRSKPKVGFLVTRGHEGGFLASAAGIIEHLDRERFQPVVFCAACAFEQFRRRIRRKDIVWITLENDFRSSMARVREAGCEVLYHWQIGTDGLNYFLAFANLGAVVCTSWGTHGTSGIKAVDYYLSSELIEPEGAEEHYTEALYRLSTLPTYQRRVAPPPPTERSHFGLPERGALYLCPGRLAKFHPDMDPLLAGILACDAEGHIVILKGNNERAVWQLQERLKRNLGSRADRVFFLPSFPVQEYMCLLSLSDVIIDTPHYSLGRTAYDVFSLGLPVVTLPGEFAVGRYTYGCYRKMGLKELVARSPEEYIELAVRVAREPDYREYVCSEIAQRSEILFEDTEAVREHERFFEEAVRRCREGASPEEGAGAETSPSAAGAEAQPCVVPGIENPREKRASSGKQDPLEPSDTRCVSHSHRAIFVHVPKTGGTSLITHLSLADAGHVSAARIRKDVASRVWEEYFKFAFVRNPWDRFVSVFFYFAQMHAIHPWYRANQHVCRLVQSFHSFTEFCRGFPFADLRSHPLFVPQSRWVVDDGERIIVDFVGRYESLQKDADHVCDTLGLPRRPLPRLNASQHRRYRDYYDRQTRRLVASLYRADIELFEYEF